MRLKSFIALALAGAVCSVNAETYGFHVFDPGSPAAGEILGGSNGYWYGKFSPTFHGQGPSMWNLDLSTHTAQPMPAPYNTASFMQGAEGGVYVGSSFLPSEGTRAILWDPVASTLVPLQPSHIYYSVALATSGNQQVGISQTISGANQHACMWSGSPDTFVDLTPSGVNWAYAFGVGGNQQVGQVQNFNDFARATLWTGTAASRVDLHPGAGYNGSEARGTDGQYQVGAVGSIALGAERAAMWHGTAESFVDMTPPLPNVVGGRLYAVKAGRQAGVLTVNVEGGQSSVPAAWAGSAATGMILPAPGYFAGIATCIDEQGNIGGFVIKDLFGSEVRRVPAVWIRGEDTFLFSDFMAPMTDPASPESEFNKGRTIPIKFTLSLASGQKPSAQQVTISLTQLSPSNQVVSPSLYAAGSNPGDSFRHTNGIYVYNIDTSKLESGGRYQVTATLGNGLSHSCTFSLR